MLVAALLLNVAASASSTIIEAPVIAGRTTRSMDEFGSCFISAQARQSRQLWVVNNEGGGGRISNDGVKAAPNPYKVRFTAGRPHNRVELFLAKRDPAEERALVEAIRTCW